MKVTADTNVLIRAGVQDDLDGQLALRVVQLHEGALWPDFRPDRSL